MKVSFIIPNYNGAQFLPSCLASLPSGHEVIIVDNGSTDSSILEIKRLERSLKIKNLKLKINSKNLGFAKAVNQGILASIHDYVALINNDLVLEKDWLKHVTKAIKQYPKAVAFGGLVLSRDGKFIESEGLQYFWHGRCLNINNSHPIHNSYFINHKSPHPVWGLNAAATVYNRQVLIDIGMFDEDFFAYEEDVDLSLRFYKLGLQSAFVPHAISYHLGGGTSSKMGNFRHRMDAKNWIYIIVKNYSQGELIRNFVPLTIERLRNLSGLLKNTTPKQLPSSLLSTYGEVFRNIPKMISKRHQLQKLVKSRQSHDYRHRR